MSVSPRLHGTISQKTVIFIVNVLLVNPPELRAVFRKVFTEHPALCDVEGGIYAPISPSFGYCSVCRTKKRVCYAP
jgi:hypothetical protein